MEDAAQRSGIMPSGYLPRKKRSIHLNVIIRDDMTGASRSWTEWIERADVTKGE